MSNTPSSSSAPSSAGSDPNATPDYGHFDDQMNWVPGSTAQPEGMFDGDCYRDDFTGFYKTTHWWQRVGRKWIKIHDGPCTKCEGQNTLDCQEPGDPDNPPASSTAPTTAASSAPSPSAG